MGRRLALVALNPGKTRKIRFGKRRGVFLVEIDKATKRVLRSAAGGARIPDHWIGVEWKKVKPLERALLGAARDLRGCIKSTTCYEPKRDRRGRRRRCRRTFDRPIDFVHALNDATQGQLARYLEHLDPGAPQLRDLEAFAEDRRGRRPRFRRWQDAVKWAAPRSRRWQDIDRAKLRELEEKLHEALGAGGGGQTTFSRLAEDFRGHSGRGSTAWTGLPLPEQALRFELEEHEHRGCRELFDQAAADLVDQFRRELEELVPF